MINICAHPFSTNHDRGHPACAHTASLLNLPVITPFLIVLPLLVYPVLALPMLTLPVLTACAHLASLLTLPVVTLCSSYHLRPPIFSSTIPALLVTGSCQPSSAILSPCFIHRISMVLMLVKYWHLY